MLWNSAVILFSFTGLAIVCDEYYVPALEVIAEHWGLSPDVAGATLMAAGGSAPELFTNLIGTFKKSDVGFGTIVGSAAFNLQVITAICVVAIPDGEGRTFGAIKVRNV